MPEAGSHAEFVRWFVERYQETQGTPYPFSAKDAVIVARLLKLLEPDELRARASRLLDTDEPWIAQTDRGLRVLSSQINKPVLRGLKPPQSVPRNPRVGSATPSPASAFTDGQVTL